MKSKIYKKLILLIASVLLIISVISAATLGWFYNNENVRADRIDLSTEDFVEINISSSTAKYIVPTGYNSGMAPGCLAYYTIHLDNSSNEYNALFSIDVDFDKSTVPSNLQVYTGNFNPSGVTLSAGQNSMWQSTSYVSGTGLKSVCKNNIINSGSKLDYTVAFFWPYSSNSNAADDLAFGTNSKSFMLKVYVNAQTV